MSAGPPDLSAVPDGTPLSEIAAVLGITIREVRKGLAGLGREPTERRASSAPRKQRRRDSAVDAEIVRRYEGFETIQEIARALHLSTMTVMSALDRYGIERRSRGFRRVQPNHARPQRRIDGDAVVAFHRKGLTHRQIADELGCGVTTVRERLHEAGIRRVFADPGRDAEIAHRWADGQTLREIGAAVGMSRSGVEGAVRRLGLNGEKHR